MKKSAIMVAIVFMMIGFAAVSTTLVINGNAKVSENNEDFSVIFTAATLDGKDSLVQTFKNLLGNQSLFDINIDYSMYKE